MLRFIVSGSLVAFAVAIAISAGCANGPTGSAAVATCKDPPSTGPLSAACTACGEDTCTTQTTAVSNACAGYLSCYSACACDDAACIATCYANTSTSCQNAVGELATCTGSTCSSQCGGVTNDAGPTDAGATDADGGLASVTCKGGPATGVTSAACASCGEASCASQYGAAETACATYLRLLLGVRLQRLDVPRHVRFEPHDGVRLGPLGARHLRRDRRARRRVEPTRLVTPRSISALSMAR